MRHDVPRPVLGARNPVSQEESLSKSVTDLVRPGEMGRVHPYADPRLPPLYTFPRTTGRIRTTGTSEGICLSGWRSFPTGPERLGDDTGPEGVPVPLVSGSGEGSFLFVVPSTEGSRELDPGSTGSRPGAPTTSRLTGRHVRHRCSRRPAAVRRVRRSPDLPSARPDVSPVVRRPLSTASSPTRPAVPCPSTHGPSDPRGSVWISDSDHGGDGLMRSPTGDVSKVPTGPGVRMSRVPRLSPSSSAFQVQGRGGGSGVYHPTTGRRRGVDPRGSGPGVTGCQTVRRGSHHRTSGRGGPRSVPDHCRGVCPTAGGWGAEGRSGPYSGHPGTFVVPSEPPRPHRRGVGPGRRRRRSGVSSGAGATVRHGRRRGVDRRVTTGRPGRGVGPRV